MSLNAVEGNFFSDSFITNNLSDFNELLRLSTLSAQNLILGKDPTKQDEEAKKILTLLEALDYPGITADEQESIQYCLTSFRNSNTTSDNFAFSSSFITAYQSDFNKFLSLSTTSAQKLVLGKDYSKEDAKLAKMLTLLEALDYPGITEKESESLEYCLSLFRNSSPTVENFTFSAAFITAYQSDFEEFLRLSTLSAQRLIGGKDYTKQDTVIKKMLTIFEALDYIGITEKEEEAFQSCLNSFRMKNPTVQEFTFSDEFIQLYCSSFKEYLKLSTHTAKRIVAGKQPGSQEARSERLITILRALYVGDLTFKQTEALQYCLLLLNHTLSSRDLSAIYTPDGCPPEITNYYINAFGALFYLTGQDVTFSHYVYPGTDYSIEAEYGSFVLTGQDVTFSRNYNLEAEYGSFTLSGQNATFVHDVAQYLLEFQLNEAVVGAPQWSARFEIVSPSSFDILTGTGNGATDSGVLPGSGDVVCTVYKNVNGIAPPPPDGETEDYTDIYWFVNAGLVDSQAAVAGTNLDGTGTNYKQFTFTGLSPDDVLRVEVWEG